MIRKFVPNILLSASMPIRQCALVRRRRISLLGGECWRRLLAAGSCWDCRRRFAACAFRRWRAATRWTFDDIVYTLVLLEHAEPPLRYFLAPIIFLGDGFPAA